MGTALDALTTHQPLNSRRPGAPSLPSFELPAPNFQLGTGTPKYHSHSNIHPPTTSSVSNLLTPPASTQSGENTAATHITSTTTSTTVSASPDLAPSYGTAYWPGHHSYGTAQGTAPRQPWNTGINAPYPPRDTFSPPVSHLGRNPVTSPPVTEGMTHPYDMHQLPPFQQSLSLSSSSIPTVTPQQQQQQQQQQHQQQQHQQQQHQQQQQQQQQHHHAMAHAMLTTQHALPNPGPSPHLLPSNDPYGPKSQSAPVYGAVQQIPSPHAAGYPPYGQPGLAMHLPGRVSSNPPLSTTGPPHHLNYPRQPWPSYSLPAMNGPVMTNIHSPNSQMSLLGSMQPGMLPAFNSGVASMQQMYGGHPAHQGHQPGPTNDRPFKCDQCPQSFNRNHDLKRHKRIHLSVKPFPCTHCDKSFSRKDALKRHILVKGCGKDASSDAGSTTNASSGKPSGDTIKEEDRDSVDTNGNS